MSTLCLFALSFAAHAVLEPPDPRALAPNPASTPNRMGARQATRECLEIILTLLDRTDVDVLQNGDLAVHTAKGIRIEKPNDRGTLIDPRGNCASVDTRGKLFDRDSYESIVSRGVRAASATPSRLDVCARADQARLRDMVTTPNRPPAGVSPGIGR